MANLQEKPIKVNGLLTHKHPDLDAVLSLHLMIIHGETLFPGSKDADISFVSANRLPDGKTAADLEAEGIIAVDTGGGRLDTHPVDGEPNKDKWDTCASQLVAEALGVDKSPEYQFLLPYTLNHDARGQSLTSTDAIHHLLAPHGLIEGLHSFYENDLDVVKTMRNLVSSIAEASKVDEIPIEETAKRFDLTLAEFLNREEFEDTKHLRKEAIPWTLEGEAHSIARQNGWEMRRDLEKLLKIDARLLSEGNAALPDLELERRILLPAALNGFAAIYGEFSDEYYENALVLFKAAYKRESDWFSAIDEVERSAKVIRGRGVSLVAIASKNGLTIKASRYRRGANAVLYFEPNAKNVTLQSGQRKDGTPLLNLERIAKRIRAAEVMKRKGNGVKLNRNLGEVGLVEDWFLHPSLKLLNRGSPKAPDVPPSALSWKEIIDIVKSDIRPDEKLPDWFCPVDKCTEAECSVFQMRFINCNSHRKQVKGAPAKGTIGELFAAKFNNNKKK
jgi:hypothetical protein